MTTRFSNLSELPSPLTFSRFEAKTDVAKPGFYSDVLIIESGVAKGHYAVKDGNWVVNYNPDNPVHAELRKYQIVIGEEMLDDVVLCGAEADGGVKAKLDHGATVRDIIGNYFKFRRVGNQVRADLTLMKSTPHRGYVEELFSDFAKKVGNSIDFDFKYEINGNIAVARCKKLNSVDIVDAPAATNSLFTENQTLENNMALSKEDLEAINAVVNTAIETKFNALEKSVKTRFEEIESKIGEDEDEDEEKKKLEEEEKKKEDDKAAMSATAINKAVLSAMREILPKTTIENLNSLALSKGEGKDEYEEKLQLCEAAGITGTRAVRHIANKFPAIYNAKFGNGGGQKGSATSTKL